MKQKNDNIEIGNGYNESQRHRSAESRALEKFTDLFEEKREISEVS